MDWGSCVVNGAASLRCVPVLFANVLNVLFMLAGTIAAIIIIISGMRMILASGDAKQLETAQKTLVWAIAGLLLIFFSYLILAIIAEVTGVKCILSFGPWATGSCAR